MSLRGDRIIRLRKELNLTQARLAELVDVTSNHISKYENGYTSPTLPTLSTLAQTLNTTTDYLLGLSDIPHPGAEPDANADLTPDEIELLTIYRERSAGDRKRLLGIFEMIRGIGRED